MDGSSMRGMWLALTALFALTIFAAPVAPKRASRRSPSALPAFTTLTPSRPGAAPMEEWRPLENTVTSARQSELRMPSDVKERDFVVDCAHDIPAYGYSATTASGVDLDSEYARERSADEGLVHLMPRDRRAKAFHIPRGWIRTAIRFGYDMDVLDRTDLLLLTDGMIAVVNTSTTNAGIFTESFVWRFRSTSDLNRLPEPLRRFANAALGRCGS